MYLGVTNYIAPVRRYQDYDGCVIVHMKGMDRELFDASG